MGPTENRVQARGSVRSELWFTVVADGLSTWVASPWWQVRAPSLEHGLALPWKVGALGERVRQLWVCRPCAGWEGWSCPVLSSTQTRVAGASGPGGVSAAPRSCYPGQKLTPSSSSRPFPQFPDIVEFCENMANSGKTVIVAALDGTFQRKVKCLVQVLGWDQGRRGLGSTQNWTAQLALDAHTMPEPRHSGQPDPAPWGDPDSTCLGLVLWGKPRSRLSFLASGL